MSTYAADRDVVTIWKLGGFPASVSGYYAVRPATNGKVEAQVILGFR